LERRREGERVEKEKRDSTLKEDEREGRGGRGFPHFSLECPMTCLWVRGSLWVDCCWLHWLIVFLRFEEGGKRGSKGSMTTIKELLSIDRGRR
jgi:hypothetical protein